MLVVPSNKEGTGFLNYCYDKKICAGYITEKEFNALVLCCSRIAATSYSRKQILDRQKTTQKMYWYISLSTLTAMAGIAFLTFSAIESFPVLDVFASIFLFPSIIAVFGINIYTWKKSLP